MTDLRARPSEQSHRAEPIDRAGSTNRAAPALPLDDRPQYRPPSRRRRRIAIGVALAAAAIAGNVFVYAGLDERQAVVQVVRDVPAGELIQPDMLRPVDVELDRSVAAVPAADLPLVAGQYAKVRLVAGSLVTAASLQTGPLVADDSSVVAVRVPDGSLPVGLRERSPVELVIPVASGDASTPPVVVAGRTVGLPSTPSTAVGTTSVSVEVASDHAATVAAAGEVRIVLVEPYPDAAIEPASGEPR
jgi:hypothetical protein